MTMEHVSDIVDLVHPTVSGLGIFCGDTIWVLFDREIDENSLSNGNMFVTGPDFDTWSGPDLQIFLGAPSVGDEDQILQSPGYHGMVQGTFEFERIALTSLSEVVTQDTVGSGHLFRTKAIFTPTNRLQTNTEYTVYLSGDEDSTDDLTTGLTSRTIFDQVAWSGNTSTSEPEFTGSYNGLVASDTFRVDITTSGYSDSARFTFQSTSDSIVHGPFRAKESPILLSDGVSLNFTDGILQIGDYWTVVVKEPVTYSGNLVWPFQTGSGSIETLPTTTSTTVLGIDTVISTTATTTTFTVVSTEPEDGDTNLTLPTNEYDITVEFDNDIDSATVVSGVDITVFSESVNGETTIAAEGDIIAKPAVSGTELTITIPSGVLLGNNLVTVTLDSTIAGINGTSLGTDYEFSFTTAYTPMYCTLRRTKLNVGAYITNIPDDTINMAIFEASREAESLTWNTDYITDDYYMFVRSQWTCCRAAQILLINATGGAGQLKSKKLGDMAVEYNNKVGEASIPLARVEDCMAKWEGALRAGGRQVQVPGYVIKGEYDPDRPHVGRRWLHEDFDGSTPAATIKGTVTGSRRWTRGWWHR
jgi:hypothetical protein